MKRLTQEQMTAKMVSDLKLDEKQTKKVTKLNKKYKKLIEGESQEGQGGQQQASYDYNKQQTKYDKQMRKLLSDEQYEGYLKLKPQFYSQRKIREFLIGGNGMNGEMGMPPGGFGGQGSQQKDIYSRCYCKRCCAHIYDVGRCSHRRQEQYYA